MTKVNGEFEKLFEDNESDEKEKSKESSSNYLFNIKFSGGVDLSNSNEFSDKIDFENFIEFMRLNDFDKAVEDFISDWFFESGYDFSENVDFMTSFLITQMPIKKKG